jgi:Bacterial Ig-like domain (group 2)
MRQLAIGFALVTMCACGDNPPRVVDPLPSPQSVAINPASATTIKVGQEQAYTAAVRYSDGTDHNDAVTWSSDNSDVATIDGTGKARGVGSGEATLIASAQGLGPGTLKIRVMPDYQGTWEGEYTVKGCRRAEAFDSEWCDDELFKVGLRLPIALVLTQDRDRLMGAVFLGTLEHAIDATSAIQVDGGAAVSARGSVEFDEITLTPVLDPFRVRAQGTSLTGTFTYTIDGTNVPGSVIVNGELHGVTRTSALTAAGHGVTFATKRDLPRLLRQR